MTHKSAVIMGFILSVLWWDLQFFLWWIYRWT